MKTNHGLGWSVGLLALALALPAQAFTRTWSGAVNGDWSNTANWVESAIPADGDDLIFPISSNTAAFRQPDNNTLSDLKVRSITFWTNTVSPGPLTLAGNAFTLDGGYGALYTITNANRTAGREVTISNAVALSGDQRWSGSGTASANANGIVIFAGNLSGSGNLIVTNLYTSSGKSSKPSIRLGGSNSGYTGTIRFGNQGCGLFLLSPAAMTGGLIDLNAADSNVHLTGNDPATPYTFGSDNTAGSPNINFGKDSPGGLYLAGGDVYWLPLNTASYTWPAGTLSQINHNGANEATPARMLYLGSTNGSLVLTGDRKLSSQTSNNTGNHPGHITLLDALADDATGGRTLSVEMYDTILTRPAVESGAVHSKITVNAPGMLVVSNMNQLFSGNLALSGGGLLFNGLSWGDFVANRTGGYGASIPAGSQPGTITATAGGSLTAGAYSYRVVAVTSSGTSAPGTYRAGTTSGGNLTLPVSWAAQTGAILYRVYRHTGSATFTVGDLIYEGNTLSISDNGLAAIQSGVTLPSDTTVGDHAWATAVSGFGFAARGEAVTIDPQQTTPTTFDANFFLGSPLRQSDGTAFANAPVILDRGAGSDTLALNASVDRTIDVYGPSPMGSDTYYDFANAGPINEIAGRITGGGPGRRLFFPGKVNNASVTPVNFGLLRLSNTGNTFQASVLLENSNNSALGALLATDDRVFGDPANVVSLRSESTGWLVLFENQGLGDKSFGRTLTLTNSNNNAGMRMFGFGAYAGSVVYTGAVNVIGTTNTGSGFLQVNLHVESNAVLKLGDSGAPCTLSNNRTPSSSSVTNFYRKMGPGTLVLQNLNYADAGGNRHIFQIGRGGGGVTNYSNPCYFDGAVRETGDGASNSFAGQNIVLAAGVLETCDAVLGGPFTRSLGPDVNQIRWGANSGGGFSAYGGPLTVNLYGFTPATNISYNTTYFPRKMALMFGSRTANNVVTWLNPTFFSGSSADATEIRVIDNPDTAADRAVIAGNIGGTVGGTAAYFYKGGDGVLEFASGMHCANTGMLMVCAGTLVVNGSIDKLNTYNVYVTNNATLAGNGRIDRPLIMLGGAIAPGDVAPGNVVGTLTVTNLTLSATSALNLDLGTPGASDKLVVLNGLTLAGTINATNVAGFAAGDYEIVTYAGTLAGTAAVGAMPATYSATLNTNTAGKIILAVTGSGNKPGGTVIALY